MIKILKDGVLQKNTKVIYKVTCPNCRCEFEFEKEDCKSIERRINGYVTVECPCCHRDISHQPSNYRLVEVEAEKKKGKGLWKI